jgi:hypothetical protein
MERVKMCQAMESLTVSEREVEPYVGSSITVILLVTAGPALLVAISIRAWLRSPFQRKPAHFRSYSEPHATLLLTKLILSDIIYETLRCNGHHLLFYV